MGHTGCKTRVRFAMTADEKGRIEYFISPFLVLLFLAVF